MSTPVGSTPSRREAMKAQQIAHAEKARKKKIALAGLVVLLVLVVIAIVATSVNQSQKTISVATQVVPKNANSDDSGIIVNPGKAKSGVPTLTVYQDYQCPACKAVENVIGGWTNNIANNGDVKLEYRTMTFLDTNFPNSNKSSERAATMAACVDEYATSHYMKYHDTVYANQSTTEGAGYTDDQLRNQFTKEAGISGDELTAVQKCYDIKATLKFVQQVDADASKAGITGTPTYEVNGKKLDLGTIGNTQASFLAAIQKLAKS